MNCEQAIELLPWLLNGTLQESERQAVREHLAGCDRCREALAETRFAWSVYDQHLPSEALVALAYGDRLPDGLDPALAERHLATCPQCAAELELVRTSRHLEEDERIAPMPFQRKDRAAGASTTVPAAAPLVRTSVRAWRSSALAASLVGVVALSGWIHNGQRVHSLEERLAQVSTGTEATVEPSSPQPAPPIASAPVPSAPSGGAALGETERLRAAEAQLQEAQAKLQEQSRQIAEIEKQVQSRPTSKAGLEANFQSVEIEPAAAERGGDADAVEIRADRGAAVSLTADHRETHKTHVLEVLDAAGKPVLTVPGLQRNTGDVDTYTFGIPPGRLAPGTYTVQVSAQENGQKVAFEKYLIRVV
ncbi:MAG TPA: zf-HC2 domain-containing protein [Thermoanaerobaculia bacterium]|nr:zf-HC2 domain-containing protein [Thermoanaerobaculia bacterium]